MLVPAFFSILYICSSAGETLVVKALNYATPSLTLPSYTGFMSNQLWLLMLPLYGWMLYKSDKKYKQKYLMEYFGMGLLTFTTTLFRNISLNMIPGSIFGILISTSIIFNMGMSWIWLKKSFNHWHLAAAVTCLASALSVGIPAFIDNQEGNYSLGIPTAIAAAFSVALITVWQEELQPKFDDLNLRLVELLISSSMLSSVLMITYATFTKEIREWSPSINAMSLSLIIGCSLALPILKLVVRNTKYSIIQKSNAFFFEFVQASAALLGSFANILLFNESWGPGYIVGCILLAISFGLYFKAKTVAKTVKLDVMPPPPPYLNPLKIEIIVSPVQPWK